MNFFEYGTYKKKVCKFANSVNLHMNFYLHTDCIWIFKLEF